MDIKFFYKDNKSYQAHEVIITSFANLVSQLIELPDTIEVCLYPLDPNVYGGIDALHVNRIVISTELPLQDIPKILVHELIHVNQKHKGLLKIDRNGMCYWRGIPYTKKLPESMSYEEYQNLPWEQDVAQKQHNLLRAALALTK